MAEKTILVAPDVLRRFVRDVFARRGIPAEDADSIAEVLVWANLRGVDSHGVLRVPRYLEFVDQGWMKAAPDFRFERETAATFILDADSAAGPVAMARGMARAIERARDAGVSWGQVRAFTHSGAIGFYALQAARAGMIGLAATASTPNMAYHGARAAGVSTAPLAIAVPGAKHPPMLLDMATAIAAVGKLQHARDAGETLPEGWALDAAGNPTTDAVKAVLPLPLGGMKGAGLALMFECMTSLLVDNPIAEGWIRNTPGGRRHRQNGLVVAVDIAAFTDRATYERRVDDLIAALKTLPRAEGVDEILVPGERGDRVLVERERAGIPLAAGTWRRLGEAAEKLGVAMPAVRA
jgi:ureidoglycolate dehydrogenase (NAD+)